MNSIANIGHGIKAFNGFSKRLSLTSLLLMTAGLAVVIGSGCSDQTKAHANGCIIKAGTVEISRVDFVQELEVKQANYPYDIKDRPDEYNAMVLDLVSDLCDGAVLLAAAADKGIDVDAEALGTAIAEFKKDYPEDSFDRMLLERAISYSVWKNRFKKDMVIRKLIMQDLVEFQKIHPGDMIAFYKRFAERTDARDDDNSKIMDEKDLLLRLRIEKGQEVFGEWLQGLQAGYPVTIDKQVLNSFLMNAEKQ